MVDNYRAKTVSRQLASDLQFAKTKAVAENTNYQVSFDAANGRYRVEKSDGTYNGPWRSVGAAPDLGVSLSHVPAGNLVVFNALGEAMDSTSTLFPPNGDATITVATVSGNSRTVSVAGSGRISIA